MVQHKPVVHIVDDDKAVRESLQLLMQSEDIPVQTYTSAENFLEQSAEPKLGCLLLDVRMPGMSGMQLLDLLIQRDISLPVVFITGHGDVSMAVQAMKAGAADFIEKPFDTDRLLKVVRKCLSESVQIRNTVEMRNEIKAKVASLTKRERQVMDLLADGKQNKIIADELNISPRTVELHRAKVMEKLQAHSLSEVVRAAMLVN